MKIKNMKQKLIIDTDPGQDDALALLLLLQSKQFEIQAITTVAGNSTIENVTRNAKAILDLVNSKTSLYSGYQNPIQRKLVTAVVHGESGLDGFDTTKTNFKLTQNAPQKIIELIKKNPNEITLLCIGPLSNIARAFELDPTLPKLIKEIIIMGGAINVPGNMSRVSEFNFFVDPEAADIVFRSSVKKVLISLDECLKVFFKLPDFKNIKNKSLREKIIPMMKMYEEGLFNNEFKKGILVYDALAAYYLLNPSAFKLQEMNIVIETKGEHTFGMSVDEKRDGKVINSNVLVAIEVNKKSFNKGFFEILSRK